MKTEILKKLEDIALERTIPFCMSCYIKAPIGDPLQIYELIEIITTNFPRPSRYDLYLL